MAQHGTTYHAQEPNNSVNAFRKEHASASRGLHCSWSQKHPKPQKKQNPKRAPPRAKVVVTQAAKRAHLSHLSTADKAIRNHTHTTTPATTIAAKQSTRRDAPTPALHATYTLIPYIRTRHTQRTTPEPHVHLLRWMLVVIALQLSIQLVEMQGKLRTPDTHSLL